MLSHRHLFICAALFATATATPRLLAQSTGTIDGKVTLKTTGTAVHDATVTLVQLDRRASSDDAGTFRFTDVPPGTYDLIAHVHAFTDQRIRTTVTAGQTTSASFELSISPQREQITVTASGREESPLEAFQSVISIGSLELATKNAPSLGEVLEQEAGVAKRSFGPGTTRPVIRGFDGDRVLVLQDGIRTGTLSSQSGDHGEPLDVTTLERLEVVRGPATLLYGSNAIGGVVNAITGHHYQHSHPHKGLRGAVTGSGGSTNGMGAGSGSFEYGTGKWLLWGSGGAQRTGNYDTPIGEVENSHTRSSQGSVGVGRYGERGFFSVGYTGQEGRYGIPPLEEPGHEAGEGEEGEEHGEVDLDFKRNQVRLNTGIHGLGPAFDQFTVSLNYSDWRHTELEGDEIGTQFSNRQFVYRGVLDQRRSGIFSGSLGFWGMRRDFEAVGAEALAPPVNQTAFAAFGLEQFSFERFRIQIGGRVEHNGYSPDGLRDRSFTGFSGSAGVSVPLWNGGAFVTNYTRSYRAPALEELYNRGPHIGNLTFEIGDPNLVGETSHGIDVSLRHSGPRVRAELNLYRYQLGDFVYLAPTGAVEDGLPEAEYSQADARYLGADARFEGALNPNLWLLLGFDLVDAQIKESSTPLPRIPPVRGRVGFDARKGGFSFRPELILTNQQHQLFPGEIRTAGYGLLNLSGSYTLASEHRVHVFGVQWLNSTDRLYRNHLSFIKDFAPEMGTAVRFTYTVRFF